MASDPPDMEVDISVITPSDVDMDIGIDAGGDVDITIDGVDFKQTSAIADAAYQAAQQLHARTSGGSIDSNDWYMLFYKNMAKYMEDYNTALKRIDQALYIIATAEAKLIKDQEISAVELASVGESLAVLDSIVVATGAQVNKDISSLEVQANRTEYQLWNGAEHDIALLRASFDKQSLVNAQQLAKIDYLQQQLDTVVENNFNLYIHEDQQQRQNIYYFWILGGCMVALLEITIRLLLKNRR